MKRPSRLSYAYAVGRVRALEQKLIAGAIFREAAEEKDYASAMKTLFEAGSYDDDLLKVEDSDELDEFITEEDRRIYGLMRELLQEENIRGIIAQESQPEKVLGLAEETEYDFIRDYLRHRIDLGNLKILLRAKYSGLSLEKYEHLIMSGGFLDESIFLQGYELSFPEIGEMIQTSSYLDLWNSATDALDNYETFVPLERGIDDFLTVYLRRAKYIVFGPEPIFAYVLAKRRELSLLRLVTVGKIQSIPVESIKQRIGETYV